MQWIPIFDSFSPYFWATVWERFISGSLTPENLRNGDGGGRGGRGEVEGKNS